MSQDSQLKEVSDPQKLPSNEAAELARQRREVAKRLKDVTEREALLDEREGLLDIGQSDMQHELRILEGKLIAAQSELAMAERAILTQEEDGQKTVNHLEAKIKRLHREAAQASEEVSRIKIDVERIKSTLVSVRDERDKVE